MPTAPQTWTALQALQWRMFNEVLVNSASPFSTLSSNQNPDNPGNVSDATRYGTNPFGTVTTAVIIGVPKAWPALYPKQCHIIPPMHAKVHWRALGGKTWDEKIAIVRFVFQRTNDWYQTQQDLINAADATYAMLAKHAEMVNAPTVAASRVEPMPQIPAYHHDEVIGVDFDCWGFGVWMRQEFASLTGVNA